LLLLSSSVYDHFVHRTLLPSPSLSVQLLIYAIGILIVALLVWFDVFYRSDVIRVGNRTELISAFQKFGMISLLTRSFINSLDNRRSPESLHRTPRLRRHHTQQSSFPCGIQRPPLGMLCVDRHARVFDIQAAHFQLGGKDQCAVESGFGTEGSSAGSEPGETVCSGYVRLSLTCHQLDCCGYFSPFVEATTSNTCYARSTLPGCKSRYLKFERKVLKNWYIAAFAIVPAHLAIIVTGLLCANHVTYRFGKGLMPKRYRLDAASMAVIMDEYAGSVPATLFNFGLLTDGRFP
jgi:hypothetical protein